MGSVDFQESEKSQLTSDISGPGWSLPHEAARQDSALDAEGSLDLACGVACIH